MSDRYGYVYKITNKLNNKVYVGQRKSNKVDNYYWGSGKLVAAAIAKYGQENFQRDILQWCYSKEELNQAEIYWIQELNALTQGYNLSPGGNGGYLGQETSKNVSKSLKLYYSDPENRRKHSQALKGMNNGQKGRSAATHSYIKRRAENLHKRYARGELVPPMQGKHHKESTLQKMSECKLGEKNPFYGKHHSLESKQSMSEKLKGHVVTQECREKISKANSGENNGMYGKKPPNANKICITDGFKNKYVTEEEMITFLDNGWRRGSTQNHKK